MADQKPTLDYGKPDDSRRKRFLTDLILVVLILIALTAFLIYNRLRFVH